MIWVLSALGFRNVLQVLDNGVSVGRYCGSVQPPVIMSSSNTLEIHFKSDDSINGRGFVAYYTTTGKTTFMLTLRLHQWFTNDKNSNNMLASLKRIQRKSPLLIMPLQVY